MQSSSVGINDIMEPGNRESQVAIARAGNDDLHSSLPNGATREEYTKWKEEKAEKARRRLSDLEERLQRLEQLKSRLSRIQNKNEHMLVPNATYPQMSHAANTLSNASLRDNRAPHATWSLPGQSQHLTIEDVDDEMESPHCNRDATDDQVYTGHHRQLPRYTEPPHQPELSRHASFTPGDPPASRRSVRHVPFTPGMSGLRTVIRDEVTTTISGIVTQLMSHMRPRTGVSTSRPRTGASISGIMNHIMSYARPRTGASVTFNLHRGRTTDSSSSDGAEADQLAVSRPRTSAWMARTPKRVKTVDSVAPPDIEIEAGGFESEPLLLPRRIEDAETTSLTIFCGGLSQNSPFRIYCFSIWKSGIWNALFFVVTLTGCFWSVISVENITWSADVQHLRELKRSNLLPVEYFFVSVFALEVTIAIVALGFIRGKKSYLQISAMHRLEMAIFVVVVAERVLAALGKDFFQVRAFRIVRILQILSKFRFFTGIRNCVTTLLLDYFQLSMVFLVLVCFILCMSTLLLALLSSNFSYRCVKVEQNFVSCASDFSTGWSKPPKCDLKRWRQTLPNPASGKDRHDLDFPVMIDDFYPFERWCEVTTNSTVENYGIRDDWDLDIKGRYHSCGRGRKNYKKGSEMCVEVGNPNYGLSHFDDLGGAVLTLMQSVTQDGYVQIMWRSFQSAPDASGAFVVLWLLFTIIGTWLLVGIFLAVVTDTFASVRKRQGLQDKADERLDEEEDLLAFQELSIQRQARRIKQLLQVEHDTSHLDALIAAHHAKVASESGDRKSRVTIQDEVQEINILAIEEEAPNNKHTSDKVLMIEDEDFKTTNHTSDTIFEIEDKDKDSNGTRTSDKTMEDLAIDGRLATAKSDEEWEEEREDMEQILSRYAHAGLIWKPYVYFKSCCILGHALTMAGDQNEAPLEWRHNARVSYFVFNILFALDLIVRICASQHMNPGHSMVATFANAKKNIFEFFLTIVGITGLITNIKVFLLIPVLRVYLLLEYFPTLHHILVMALESSKPLVNVCVFIFVIALAVGVMGRDVFEERMDSVRWNFSTFPEAMLTVFQLMTGDGWSAVLHDAIKAQTDAGKNTFLAIFLIVAWFVFGFVFINNLFVAIIIEAFELTETIQNCEKPGHVATLRRELSLAWQYALYITKGVASGQVKIDVHDEARPHDPHEQNFIFTVSDTRNLAAGVDKKTGKQLLEMDAPAETGAPKLKSAMTAEDKKKKRSHVSKLISWVAPNIDEHDPTIKTYEPKRILSCLSVESRVRRLATQVGESSVFEGVVLAAITASCVSLFIMPPSGLSDEDMMRIDPDFKVFISRTILALLNYVFTGLFTVELLVRVCSRGLYFTERAYLKDGWNVMDALIVGFSWVEVIFELSGSQLSGEVGKVLRLARALRPLRVMKRNPSMRAIVGALLGTLRPVVYVIFFQMVTLLVFAIIGMGIFGGLYKYCNTSTVFGDETVAFPAGKRECVSYFVTDDGVMFPRSWDNPNFHFDTLAESAKTLFVVQYYPFVNIMHASMDLTSRDSSPVKNHSMTNSIFFGAYVFVGGIFCVNLFVAFIVDGFHLSRGTTDADIQYGRFQSLIVKHQPNIREFLVPKNLMSTTCRSILDNPWWQRISLLCVTTNVAWNLTEHTEAPAWQTHLLVMQNQVFDAVLFFEVFMNFIGFGPRGLISDRWKAFDLLVAGGSVVGYASGDPSVTRFAKAFRLVRVLRLMIMVKSVRSVLETALACMPELVNVLVLLLLIYSMFAVMFIQTFGMVKYGERLGLTAHFYSFGPALGTIYQIVCGDAWELLMSDCSVEWPKCTKAFNEENVHGWTAWKGKPMDDFTDCGSQLYSFGLFSILKIVCQQIMLNLFIGIILENFSCIAEEISHRPDEAWSLGPSTEQIETISTCYFMFCLRRKKLTVSLSDLRALLCVLPLPIGFRKADGTLVYGPWERAAAKLIRAELNLLLRNKRLERANAWNPFRPLSEWMSVRHTGQEQGKRVSLEEVDFVDVLSASIFWRRPQMIPLNINNIRRKKVGEVISMTYALIITDFFSNQVSRRVAANTRSKLEAGIRFRQWAQTDAVRCRYTKDTGLEVAAANALANLIHEKPVDLYRPPNQRISGKLEYVHRLPENCVTHNEMFEANIRHKKVVTLQSIETFRKSCQTHLVVLRDLDVNPKNTGYFMGDLTHLNFKGWVIKDNPHDAFLAPVMRRTSNQVVHGLEQEQAKTRSISTPSKVERTKGMDAFNENDVHWRDSNQLAVEIKNFFMMNEVEITLETANYLIKEAEANVLVMAARQMIKEADRKDTNFLEPWTAIDLFMTTNDRGAEEGGHEMLLPLGSIVNVQSFVDTEGGSSDEEGAFDKTQSGISTLPAGPPARIRLNLGQLRLDRLLEAPRRPNQSQFGVLNCFGRGRAVSDQPREHSFTAELVPRVLEVVGYVAVLEDWDRDSSGHRLHKAKQGKAREEAPVLSDEQHGIA